MAKVMISLPDELLDRIDAYAEKRRTSRSGLLRDFAQREIAADADARGRRVQELLANPGNYGGRGAEYVRADRNRDNP